MQLRSIFSLLLALLLSVTQPQLMAAEPAASKEYAVKAAMLCNFAQFVEWPKEAFDAPDAPLVIGVVGDNPFGSMLDKIAAEKTIGGRAIAVRYFASKDAMGKCHVLFVPASQIQATSQILQVVQGRPVLTVGEAESFPWMGGIIRFYSEENKVRFEINPEAAEQAGLKISSKLMKLARIFSKDR